MKLSQKCRYALRAVLELSRNYGNAPLSIPKIAQKREIPPMFLQTILRELKSAGVVESHRGKEGGYSLATEPRRITMWQVIFFVDGQIPDEKDKADELFDEILGNVTNLSRGIFENVTFEELAQNEISRESKSAPEYYI